MTEPDASKRGTLNDRARAAKLVRDYEEDIHPNVRPDLIEAIARERRHAREEAWKND